jgi:hypothetical protein
VAANQLQDPAYFDSLVQRLHGLPRERDTAINDLRHYGADAVPALLDRLGMGAGAMDHGLLLFTLVNFGPVAVEPLLGALEATDPRTRVLALETLGWIGDDSIVPRLWYPALAADQPPLVQRAALEAIARIRFGEPHLTDRLDPVGAADEIYQRARTHFRGDYRWPVSSEGTLELWSWDRQTDRLTKTVTKPTAASMIMAERLARQALQMAPDRDDYRALFLAATLAHSRYRAGWDQPLPVGPGTAHNLALFSGAVLTESALHLAIEHRNAAAAIGAASALGQMGTHSATSPHGDRPPALIEALDYPNDRVQFAAAVSILQLEPAESFRGSHRVVEILARALQADAGRRGIVIDPNVSRGIQLASALDQLGYVTSVARTGQEGFNEAVTYGDTALAVLHPNTIRWELTQTIANFRADSRTAGIPIVIAAGEPTRAHMQQVLARVPVSAFVSVGGDASDWLEQLQPVLAEVSTPPLTPSQQQARRQAAAYWLAHISQQSSESLFDLAPAERALSEAATDPAIGPDALLAMEGIGRPSIQQRYADIVLAPAIGADLREAAARRLANHMRQYGRLLSDESVTALTAGWGDATEPQIRTALSAVLGMLQPTSDAILEKLQSYTVPSTPQP